MTIEYQIHLPDYLAKCINKDKPQLHCDGQCALMQKIKEKEKEESAKNLLVYAYSAHYVHKESINFINHPAYEEVIEKVFSTYRIDYRFTFLTSVFRPPLA